MSLRTISLSVTLVASLGVLALMAADPPPVPLLPGEAQKQFQEGQWREAFESYKRRAMDEQNSGKQLADDLLKAIQSLRNLQQDHQIDVRCRM